MKDNKRLIWLDYMRVFAMFIIVLSHTPIKLNFIIPFTYIYLTTFFLCSGIMFNVESEQDFYDFFIKRVKTLIIPFLSFHFISYFFWLFFDRNFGTDVSNAYAWYEPLPDIFLGRFAIDDAPLWFLTALFSVEIIAYFIIKYLNKKQQFLALLILIIIGYLSQKYITIKLPMMLHTVVVAINFYLIGNLFKKEIFSFVHIKIPTHLLLAFVGVMIVYYGSLYNGKIAMHINQYGNYWLFLFLSSIAMTSTISLCTILEKIIGRIPIIEYISRNLIVIVGLHMMVGKLIKAITLFIFNLPLTIYDGGVIINILFAFISIVLLIPIMRFFNKYCPKFIGK